MLRWLKRVLVWLQWLPHAWSQHRHRLAVERQTRKRAELLREWSRVLEEPSAQDHED